MAPPGSRRDLKRRIRRRAHELALQAEQQFALAMFAELDAGKLEADAIAEWQPPAFDNASLARSLAVAQEAIRMARRSAAIFR